jgi:hypothetical protein
MIDYFAWYHHHRHRHHQHDDIPTERLPVNWRDKKFRSNFKIIQYCNGLIGGGIWNIDVFVVTVVVVPW